MKPLYTLPFARPLLRGTLVHRYKRFLAEVELDGGERVVAHCVNTGPMEGLPLPGRRVWLSPAVHPNRRLRYTWELVEVDHALVGCNTILANRLVRGLLETRALPGLKRWTALCAEYQLNEHSRLDFWLAQRGVEVVIEVKNCHLVYPDRRAYFPDTASVRATKHLNELAALAARGRRALVLFIVQRADADAVRPSDAHDPAFAAAARRARGCGVEFRAFRVRPTTAALHVEAEIPVDLQSYDVASILHWRAQNKSSAAPPP